MTDYIQMVLATLEGAVSATESALKKVAEAISQGIGEFQGREAMHYENILAHAVMAANAQEPESVAIQALFEQTWPRYQSPIGLRNKFLRANRQSADPMQEFRRIAMEASAERKMANEMDPDEAHKMISNKVAELARMNPELTMTFGYIGNCDLWGNRFDDRSFMIFTGLGDTSNPGASVKWGGYAYDQLGLMAVNAERELEDWVINVQAKRIAGQYVSRSGKKVA